MYKGTFNANEIWNQRLTWARIGAFGRFGAQLLRAGFHRRFCAKPGVHVGWDLRSFSRAIAEAVIAALWDAGLMAVRHGAVRTPALALTCVAAEDGAVMITGSHTGKLCSSVVSSPASTGQGLPGTGLQTGCHGGNSDLSADGDSYRK